MLLRSLDYTTLVFFRGLHCPVCRAQLTELNRRLDELRDQDIDVIAVSGETREGPSRSLQSGSSTGSRLATG